MNIRYAHTNIICKDWEKLVDFYCTVFDCVPVPPKRDQSGEWLEKGTGVKEAHLQGMHLRLPGHGDNGPTLEIYSYKNTLEKPSPSAANREGFGHLAFEVENIDAVLSNLLSNGGRMIGEIVTKEVIGVGIINFTYAADPEDNIIEIQNWKYSNK